MQFDGQPYSVKLFKNLINKVVSDPNLNAEKMSVLQQLEQVLKSADYSHSSAVDRSTQMKSDIIRYDYLVSNVIINGTDYSVDMTVEVYGGQNKFKTYLLKDIEMTPTSSLSENVHPSVATGPVPALGESGASSIDNVAQNAASVNSGASDS